MLELISRLLNRLAYSYRRRPYLATIALILLVYVVISNQPYYLRPQKSRLRFVKSGYDWSSWQLFHPIEYIQPLPARDHTRLPKIQSSNSPKSDPATQLHRRDEVKRIMQRGWKSYKQFAWMRDELAPVTGGAKDTFGGWGATLVDSLDTLWIMDMKEEFWEAAQAAVSLDWAYTKEKSCNMFETTIRHLGGLLSAYDLSGEPALLKKAVELGDMLYVGFDTPNRMPPFWFDFEKAKTGRLIPDDHQPAASAATLSLEFTRLAQLTGDNKYYDAITRVTDNLFANQNKTQAPGLWPTFFNLKDGVFHLDNTFTLGALSDSMYEYMLKMHLLLKSGDSRYEQMYRAAADAIIENLLYRPMTPENLDILFTGTFHAGVAYQLEPEMQHLACFAGGMFAIGGKVLDIPEHIDIGAALTRGCIWAYDSFPTGIGPEIANLVPCETLAGCEWDENKWSATLPSQRAKSHRIPKGFSNIREPKYILRPEALESVFIMYRITGDVQYQDAAWKMFQAIEAATATEFGNSAIRDVTVDPARVKKEDSMEVRMLIILSRKFANFTQSFWMAETLKYLYLIFSPSSLISLDDYVFNTECHPLRIYG